MEVAGALSIFQRSQSLYNVRYTKYLGDGDSKAFTSIVENKVYGDHCSVEKLECIGHVMKRMGTRLRRLKTKMRGDGVPRQTEAVTSKILLFTKTKEVRKQKRLKRKKEDDELLKNADDLEYGGGMF
ncbi:uncharacterized protein TNCV_67461 [Trichonephila clavipes]|nr:uncharacterized protein TNCV_67461 [Trichonephila clavipes]